ncbi:hypothetical protein F2Q68_00014762 [Brassica cretica]|uniref:Uncharacterized protein n=1 Tax=Brassica cretica TaxID=69181 RepID=A0A8S9HGV8_BRACR|nr:hypothetical protein F2Q68_00014762 [Brassica cretica]
MIENTWCSSKVSSQMYYNYSLRTFWNFVELSRRGYNDNVLFHRIIKVEIVLEELEESLGSSRTVEKENSEACDRKDLLIEAITLI